MSPTDGIGGVPPQGAAAHADGVQARPRLGRVLHAARKVGLAVGLVAVALPGGACGPDFPNSYLAAPESALLAAPEGFFDRELEHLAGSVAGGVRAKEANLGDFELRRRRVEEVELAEALVRGGGTPAEARGRAQAFEGWRLALEAWWQGGAANRAKTVCPSPPDGVPAEFVLYTSGASAWKSGDWAAAQEAWTALLELPEAQRRNRSVITVYMFGRNSGLEVRRPAGRTPAEALAESRRWFRLVRDLAAGGWPDPFGLAAESYGWEARAALDGGDAVAAVNLYLQQLATGDASARASLRLVAAQLVKAGVPEEVVRDPAARRLAIASIVSRVGSSMFEDEAQPPFARWAAELATGIERAGLADIAAADRLAWLAYQGGQFELAARWAKLAPEEEPMARWIRAKLALRAGDGAEGARLLGAVAGDAGLDPAMRPQAFAELGRAYLALGDFTGTLAAWLTGGHWQDAAYVAERLLTVEELVAFVADLSPAGAAAQPPASIGTSRLPGWTSGYLGGALRHLLARRLTRAGRVEEALPFFPPPLQSLARDYGADVRAGFDAQRPAGERAAAFWRAAQTVREQGLELLGTELEPDWYIWGAQHRTEEAGAMRLAAANAVGGVLAPVEEELKRLEGHRIPEKRFHYRYRAAELAGWAAALLPNDSEDAAEMLTAAGRWLALRDPQAAKPFYQLLVIRCPNTKLGRQAAVCHWFPDPESGKAEGN